MDDLLDRNNQHIFLEQTNNTGNSFIANVNLLAKQFPIISTLVTLFDEQKIKDLITVSKVNVKTIIDDLKKGTYNGFRKLDINLLTNYFDYNEDLTDDEKRALWNNPAKQIYYSGITVYFTDRTSIYKEFTEKDVVISICNHHQLYDQLNNWPEFKIKANYTMFNIVPNTPIPNHELLRIWDGEDSGSSITKIVLHVASKGQNQSYDSFFAQAKLYDPVFTWLDTTSILTTIVNSINRLLQVSDNVAELLEVYSYLSQLMSIYAVLDKLASTDASKETIFKHLDELVEIYNNIDMMKATLAATENAVKLLKDLNHKADKIDTTVTVYSTDNFDIISNLTTGFHLGDKLTYNDFTFEVTETNEEGKITNGNLTPKITNIDCTGYYEFIDDNIFGIDIHAKPIKSSEYAILDLTDVYTEFDTRLDILGTSLTAIAHKVKYLEKVAEHPDIYDTLKNIQELLDTKLNIDNFTDYVETHTQEFNDFKESSKQELNDHITTAQTAFETYKQEVADKFIETEEAIDMKVNTTDFQDYTQSVVDSNSAIGEKLDILTQVIANRECCSGSGNGSISATGLFVLYVDEDGMLCAETSGLTDISFNIDEDGILEGVING